VETLLLRWSMMDRIVDLRAVLAGDERGGRGSQGESGAPPKRRETAPPHRAAPQREANPPPPPHAGEPERSPPEAETAAPEGAAPIEFTEKGLTSAWPELIETGRGISRFLGEALAVASLAAVSPPKIELRLTDPNPMFAEALHRNLGALEQALAPRLGRTPQIRVAAGGGGAGPDERVEGEGEGEGEGRERRPRRYSEERVKSERLEANRALDPALDVAATELDLEIME